MQKEEIMKQISIAVWIFVIALPILGSLGVANDPIMGIFWLIGFAWVLKDIYMHYARKLTKKD